MIVGKGEAGGSPFARARGTWDYSSFSVCLDVITFFKENAILQLISTTTIASFSTLSSILRRTSSCQDQCRSCVAVPRPLCACPPACLSPRLPAPPPPASCPSSALAAADLTVAWIPEETDLLCTLRAIAGTFSVANSGGYAADSLHLSNIWVSASIVQV